MVESVPLEDISTEKQSKQVRYFKAKVLDTYQSEKMNQVVKESIDHQSIVFTDKSTSYVDRYSRLCGTSYHKKSNEEVTKTALKWAYIAISNAKRNLLGNYHKI